MDTELRDEVTERLERIEHMLELLIQQRTVKEWYTTAEIAKIVCKAEFTVREWCRLKRIRAAKKECGRRWSLVAGGAGANCGYAAVA
jgi:hypothetical protein